MTPQEIKERYQQILEDYRSGKIDWKTFELRLLELKLMRSQQTDSGNMGSTENETPRTPDVSPTGRFQLDELPGGGKTGANRQRTARNGLPFRPHSSIHKPDNDGSDQQSPRSSHISHATGPLQAKRRGQRLNAGIRLGADYRLLRCLAETDTGSTWMAEEIASKSLVVVKPIPLALQNEAAVWKEYPHLFRRVAALNFPGVAPVFRLAKDDILGYFTVAAYVDAVALDEYFDHYRRDFHGFPIRVLVRLLWPVAKAVDFAHRRGIVHGNLTPNNVLVGKRCGAVVTDFRLPSFVRDKMADPLPENSGPWQASEVWMDGRAVSRSDQYSLGVLAYQLIFGHRPFRAENPDELREKVLLEEPPNLERLPAGLASALRKVLSKSPDDRFASCLDFIAQLDKQGSQGRTDTEPRPPERRGLWSILFGAAALPESVAGMTLEDLWPFEDESRAPNTGLSERQKNNTFPYEKPPKGFSDTAKARTFQATAMGVGALLGASLLGGAVYWSLPTPSEKPKEEVAVQSVAPQVRAPAPQAPVRSSKPSGFDIEPEERVATPSIHQIIEDHVAPVEPEDVDRLNTLAAQGDVNAQRRLGEAFFYGKGISRDRKRAVEYFQLGADQEDISSVYHLARCYELGIGGLQKSLIRAVELYRSAAENGSKPAREALNRLNVKE